MPSHPKQYMDAADIGMLWDILKRSGYQLVETKRTLAAARFVISPFMAGRIGPFCMSHNLEDRAIHRPRAAEGANLQVWENEGGATKGDVK